MSDSAAPATPGAIPRAIIIGAGPAGLAAAEALALAGVRVAIHDAMPNPARKFLLAGRGGLNLTHSEPLDVFLGRYGAARPRLEAALAAFPPEDLRAWCEDLGQETFVGSSGRIFPRAMKASPLLRAWLARLAGLGVTLATRSRWTGWDNDGGLVFETPAGRVVEHADACIFALGGASWPRLGSNGAWAGAFQARGVNVAPLQPANCGFHVAWSRVFYAIHAGQPLKTARFIFNGRSARGEAMITDTGIEGGAIYALSGPLRDALLRREEADLIIDLHPDVSEEALAARLSEDASGSAKHASMANRLRRAGLSPLSASLLREDPRGTELPNSPQLLAARIKSARIRLASPFAIDRAISTAGGVSWDSLNEDFSLQIDPRTFVCGEMLDWEAPTGGYLLQACFATGRAAAQGALARFASVQNDPAADNT